MKRKSGSDDERPSKKRTRHSCDQCRMKKAKCDGEVPCEGCHKTDSTCTYTELKRRGLRRGYIQRLQRVNDNLSTLLGLYCLNHYDTKELEGLVDKLGGLSPELRKDIQRAIPAEIYPALFEDSTAESIGVSTPQQIEGTIPSVEENAPIRRGSPDLEPRYLGFSSGFSEPFNLKGLHMQNHVSDFASCRALVEPTELMVLLDIFFAYVHPAYPMVDKSCVIQTAMSEDSYGTSGRRCLLWTVLVYAWNLTEAAKISPDKEIVQTMQHLTFCSLKSRHSVETVQSLLLQSMFLWGRGYWSNSWILIGDALRMAIDLGLHIYPDGQSVTIRRTWKVCCMFDCLISGRLGRKPQTTPSDYPEVMEPEDSEEEWDLWRPPAENNKSQNPSFKTPFMAEPGRILSSFNANYRLNRLANKYITRTNSDDLTESDGIPGLVKETALELKEWKENLPPHLDLQNYMILDFEETKGKQLLPHIVNLYFGYASVCHLLHIVEWQRDIEESTLPRYENVCELVRKALYCFFSRSTPRKAIPTFEYFLCLCITVCLKVGVEVEGLSNPLSNNEWFNEMLNYLKLCSDSWPGGMVSYDYWDRLKDSDLRGNLERFKKTQNYEPYVFSSLQEFDGFPDLDSFSPILGTGRSCIGAMIEGLESDSLPRI